MFASTGLTDEDRAAMLKLSRDPRVAERIVDSIAPSIYGQKHVKMAVSEEVRPLRKSDTFSFFTHLEYLASFSSLSIFLIIFGVFAHKRACTLS